MIRRRSPMSSLAGLPGWLLLCALPLLAPPPAGAAAGCCEKDGKCFSTDDESECAGGTFFQLGFCSNNRCQPTVANPHPGQPLPGQPRPIGQLAAATPAASPAQGKPVEHTPESRATTVPTPPDVAAPPADAQATASGL